MKVSTMIPSKKASVIFTFGFICGFVFLITVAFMFAEERKSKTSQPEATSNFEPQVSVDPICKNVTDLSVLLVETHSKVGTSRQIRLFDAKGYKFGEFDVEYNKFNNARAYSCSFDKSTKKLSVSAGGGEIGLSDSETVLIDTSSEKATLINRFSLSLDNNGANVVREGDAPQITHHGVWVSSNARRYISYEEIGEVKDKTVPIRVAIFEIDPSARLVACKTIDECAKATSTIRLVKEVTLISPVVENNYFNTIYSFENQTNNSVDIVFEAYKEVSSPITPNRSHEKRTIFKQKVEL